MKRRTLEQSFALIQQQLAGDLSIAEFCKQNNISKTWFYKFKKNHPVATDNKAQSRFVKVERSPTIRMTADMINIQYQQIQIKLPLLTNQIWLAEFVKALS